MSDINGMIRAARALHYWETRQQAVANNLANVNTDGFKGERVFARMLQDSAPIPDAATDFTPGTLRQTGNPLDLALEGEGFFVVETGGGERLSRGGAFQLDHEGRITDSAGNPLLGETGTITVAAGGAIEVDREGTVRVDGQAVDRLRLEGVPPGTRLQHDAGTLFLPDAAREPLDPATRPVRQGAIEESNVSSIGALVDMITIQRAYSSVQRAVTTLDSIRATISTDIAKPI